MGIPLTAIEMTGIVDENSQLQLDGMLPIIGPKTCSHYCTLAC